MCLHRATLYYRFTPRYGSGAHHSSLHSATPTPARQVPRATPRSHPRLTRGGPPCSLARPAVRARTGARPRYAPMLLVLPDRALVSVASPRASTPLKGVRRTPEGCSPSKGALRAPAARAGSRPSRRQAADPALHSVRACQACARDRFVAGSGIAKVHLLISVLVSRPTDQRVGFSPARPRCIPPRVAAPREPAPPSLRHRALLLPSGAACHQTVLRRRCHASRYACTWSKSRDVRLPGLRRRGVRSLRAYSGRKYLLYPTVEQYTGTSLGEG